MSLPFCKNCNTAYNITKSVKAFYEQKVAKQQKGGKGKKETEVAEEVEPTFDSLNDMVDKLSKGISLKVKNWDSFDVNEIKKTPAYKKLKGEERDLVLNKINELKPKEKLVNDKDDDVAILENNIAFLVCSKCGYNEQMEPGTLIYVKMYDKQVSEFNLEDYKSMYYDKTLPRTNVYDCRNKKCITHTQPEKKKAVFKRIKDDKRVVYNCTVCKDVWFL